MTTGQKKASTIRIIHQEMSFLKTIVCVFCVYVYVCARAYTYAIHVFWPEVNSKHLSS